MERTVLPPACGEETQLPGIACVGCAAAVAYHPNAMDSFSVCVMASSDEVNLLGPDRSHGTRDERLLTRTLWRPPRHYHVPGTAPSGGSARMNSTRGSGAERYKNNGAAAATGASTGAADAGGDESTVKIVALLALLLKPDGTAHHGAAVSSAADDTSASPPPSTVSFDAAVPDDTMAVFVAWADDRGRHHITLLLISLKAALSPATSSPHVVLFQALDALPLDDDQRVLRLFYSHHIAEELRLRGDLPHGNPLHLILCSGYRVEMGSHSAAAHGTSNSATTGRNGAERVMGENPCRTASGPTAKLNGFFSVWSLCGFSFLSEVPMCRDSGSSGGGVASVPLLVCQTARGEWINASVARGGSAAGGNALGPRATIRIERASEADLPEWLRLFVPDRVVCCFDVMPQGAALTTDTVGMRAAAGTTDGRIYVLTTHGTRLLRRLAGPIADAAFVVCERLRKADDEPRRSGTAVVDQFLRAAQYQQRALPSRLAVPEATASPVAEPPDVALVVLDSVGRVVYFLGINKKVVVYPEIVRDVPQLIRLAERERNMLTFVEALPVSMTQSTAPMSNPPTTTSSRKFLDISTLRHFFGHHSSKQGTAASMSQNGSAAVSASVAVAGARSASDEAEEAMAGSCAGHLLSRGLLRIAQLENVNGSPELVISTHGQLLVSVPYDMQEKRFYVAGFTITPSPMHYVQFVDIFGSGCEEIVFAGLESVLVARRSRGTLRERALLLLKLLEQRRRQATHESAASATSVDVLDS